MSQVKTQPAESIRLNKYGYNTIAKHMGTVVITCLPLFLGAGTWQWDWAWVFSAVLLAGWVALSLVLARVNPEILNERGKRLKALTGTKRWDWLIMSGYSILLIVTPLLAGFDYRYGWSVPTPDALKLIGLAALVIGFVLLTWSMAVNRYFEATVRIQAQRGHHVIDGGPYHFVRHPGYVGVLLHFIAIPLSLGTLVAWIPALIGVALFVARTRLEDDTLKTELPGYAEFATRTRYRLLPGIW